MSSALAIAGVTAVIKDLLDTGLSDSVTAQLGSQYSTTAVPPDTITIGGTQQPHLNLFMWQATPNAAWRNMRYPARDAAGNRISNPPLALDLHYLLSAYGTTDLQAEVMLGYGMQLLHETPVVPRDAIRKALNPPGPVDTSMLPPIYQALRASDLADQFEQIKITQSPMNTEDTWKLWTALQAHYRPTASYTVTVVLIESVAPQRAALPVLSRGGTDPVSKRERGVLMRAGMVAPYGELQGIVIPANQPSALPGDTVTLQGHDLTGASPTAVLVNAGLEASLPLSATVDATASTAQFSLPANPAKFPAGACQVSLQTQQAGVSVSTNAIALAIAPVLSGLPATVSLQALPNQQWTIQCDPPVDPRQQVALILGDQLIDAVPFSNTTATPAFSLATLAPGTYRVRLRVDGVDSHLIDRTQSPPTFIAGQTLTVNP